MAMRWGLGPVFIWEWVRGARRWQFYATRAVFVTALLIWLALIWTTQRGGMFSEEEELIQVGHGFFVGLAVIQLTLILLAAPAATAGAVCVDKARGTLLHVLVTDLTSGEIILGKLAGRLAPVLGLIACGFPALALCAVFGGLAPETVIGAYLVTFGTAILCCSLALILSVWARKTHQALLGSYAILGLWIGTLFLIDLYDNPWAWRIAWGPVPWTFFINPYALALYPAGGWTTFSVIGLGQQVTYLGVASGISLVLILAARWGVRPRALAEANRPARREAPAFTGRLVRRLPGPPLDRNPVLWREWHRKLPSRWTGRFWSIYVVASTVASFMAIAAFFSGPGVLSGRGYSASLASFVNAGGVSIGLLLLGVSSAVSLGDERDQGSLDVVMATPLPTSTIVWGKWWGTFAIAPRLAILPIWVAIALATPGGQWPALVLMIGLILAYAAAVTSLGLALATWIPRVARVVTMTVIGYAMLAIGWPFLLLVLEPHIGFDPYRWLRLSCASPVLGIHSMTALAARLGAYGPYDEAAKIMYFWAFFWIVIYAAFAAILAGTTLMTFDRCMGRAGDRRPPKPRNRSGSIGSR